MPRPAAITLAVCAAFGAGASMAQQPVVATIAQGQLGGFVRDGIAQFRGIPFAAPPVGSRRWQPPAAAPGWRGRRDATRFGPACAQIDQIGAFAAPSTAEDCLYLNVTLPAAIRAPHRALPVLVWIPGGAFFAGSAADYDTAALARQGVIVVTLNYRLGLFGFLAHPAIDGEGHAFGNYGLMDQQAALRWVAAEIARFGGDPKRVTLAGQSAGGSSVIATLASPGARGLFARAISMSGARMIVTPLETARRAGSAFADAAGCRDAVAACLRALPVARVLALQRSFFTGPMRDGTILTADPGAAIQSGGHARVPLLTGFVAREQAFALAARAMVRGPVTAADYARDIPTFLGRTHTERILAAYPLSAFPNPTEAEIAAVQGAKACTSRFLAGASAKWAPTYAYEFTDATAPSYFPPAGFAMGAYHTGELQYLFPLFRGGSGTAHALDIAQQATARRMLRYWVNFIRSGNPNGPRLPIWPRYNPALDDMHAIGPGGAIADYGRRNRCAFWDAGGFNLY